MLLASPPGAPPAATILAASLGLTFAAGSAAAFNHIADREIDALMRRTRARPLPSGILTWRQATLSPASSAPPESRYCGCWSIR